MLSLMLGCFIAFFLSFACAEGMDRFPSGCFNVLYHWEPLQSVKDTSRAVTVTSWRPGSVFQDGNLFAFMVDKERLVVVNLETQMVLFEKEFPGQCFLHGIYGGCLIYCLVQALGTRVLSVVEGKERVFPGGLVLVAEIMFLAAWDRGAVLHVIDLESRKCLFEEPIPRW